LTWREYSYYLDVYDLSDLRRLKLQSRCALPKDNVGIGGDPATFSPRHAFFRSGHRGDGNNSVLSVAFAADGSCEVQSHPGRMRGLGPVGGLSPDRVLDVQSNGSGGLSLRLLRDADLSVVSELTLPGVAEAWLAGTTVLPVANSTLLWLGAYDPDDVSGPFSLSLVELVGDTLRERGSVRSAASLLALDTPQTLVWSEGKLARLDLTDLDRPRLSRALDVTPRFSHVLAFDEHWARLRTAHEQEGGEELGADELFSSHAKGSLELVPSAGDPDLDDATAKVEANPFGRLVRVGSLLVSVASGFKVQVVGPPRDQGPQPTLFEVFDLSDANAPKRTGELRVEQLSQPLPCTYCTGSALDSRDLVVPNALVLRVYSDAGQLELRVLDLSDPEHPFLSEPIARPESEPILAAFSVGSNIYYSYRERVSEGSGDPDRARFYFRGIDLSDVQTPRVGERVNVPGQLVAVRDEAAYTRQVTRANGTVNTYVHRLSIANGHAKVEATHEVGTRSAVGIELDASGHLLLDLRAPLQSFLYGTWTATTPTDLRVLDADTLQLVGEGHVGPGATRLGVQGERALYGAADGVILMDLSEPAAPRARAYVPIRPGGVGRGILTSDSFVIEDSGALKRYGLDFTNLP
jgi:hypothetical protein